MNSNIPTFSARKVGTAKKKVMSSTVKNKALASSSIKEIENKNGRTANLKRPFDYGLASQSKRATPMSVARSKPIIYNPKTTNTATRLNFNENLKTPVNYKRNEAINDIENIKTSLKDSNSNINRTQMETKATSPMISWNTFSNDKNKIIVLEKEIDEMTAETSRARIENANKLRKLMIDIEVKQAEVSKLEEKVSNFSENERILKCELDQISKKNLELSSIIQEEQHKSEILIKQLREELSQTISKESTTNATLSLRIASLNQQIKDYEDQQISLQNKIESNINNNLELEQLKVHSVRLQQELNVANLKIDSLTNEVKTSNENNNVLKESAHKLDEEIFHLKQENESLRLENCELRTKQSNDSLTTDEQIIHLNKLLKKSNRKCLLFSKQITSLKSVISSFENEITIDHHDISRKRINELEDLLSDYKSILDQQNLLETESNNQSTKTHISTLVKSEFPSNLTNRIEIKMKKRDDILKTTFDNVNLSLRNACQYLTGYKIDTLSDDKYKITLDNDYLNRSFYFKINDKKATILEESNIDKLNEEFTNYITNGDNCPAFLAAITLNLFKEK